MADPGWPARTPETNDTLLKTGAGVITMVANQAAWEGVAAAHMASGVASAVNTAATSATWLGLGSVSSAATATTLNGELEALAGWVAPKAGIAAAAMALYQTACAGMRTAEECVTNRTNWAADNAINPLVLGALTPEMTALDLHYFGFCWPNNSAVGATYGAGLNALAESLAIPVPIASMGASPDAPATAAADVASGAGDTAASAAMKSSFEASNVASQGAGQGSSAMTGGGEQISSMLSPLEQGVSSVMQAPSGLLQGSQQFLQAPQSMMGMFANPSMFGGGALNAAEPAAASASVAAPSTAALGAGGAGVGGGGGAVTGGGGAVPASAFTKPVSAFEPGSPGRPVGLRPSGALGSGDGVGTRPAVASMPGGMGGMPVAHGAGARGGATGKEQGRTATVQIADNRV